MSDNLKIYGIHAITEAIEAGKSIEKVYLQKESENPAIKTLLILVKKRKISLSQVPEIKLEKLSKDRNHQGAVALLSPIVYADFEITVNRAIQQSDQTLFLILDEITDIRNFGAIIRTAECTNVAAIIIPKSGSAPINADTVKTSAGAVFNIPICKVDHVKDAIYYFQGSGIQCVAATEKTDNLIYDIDLKKPTAIIMGSEGRGVNPSVLKIVDEKAKLPLLGKTDSLNVSVACGAILYEVLRQRS